ncbi:MAG TPA: phosphoribosyltransferase family protein [Candidatus Saccharimonadales bacterium]|nr:phosphoribosyltransferase family protein [Candidatus Saccharimonadales bacterium]
MARAIADVSSRDLLVSHLPTATSRIRMRGYDQASLVAKRVAQEMSLHHTPLLRRLGHQRQVGKRRSDRLQQMKNAYYVTHPQVVQGKSILLIDDVVTTGSSIESAAGALKQAGASHVFALVFALA